jgi:hypothetical protein
MSATFETFQQKGREGRAAAEQTEDRSDKIRRAFAELHSRIVEVGALQKCIVGTVAGLTFDGPSRPELHAVVNSLYGIDRFLDSIQAQANYIDGLGGLAYPGPEPGFAGDPLSPTAPRRSE